MDEEFEEVEQRVGDGCDGTVDVCREKLVSEGGAMEESGNRDVPFSRPKGSSRGRPVSLQIGNGMYWSWPWESVIWDAILRWYVYQAMEILGKVAAAGELQEDDRAYMLPSVSVCADTILSALNPELGPSDNAFPLYMSQAKNLHSSF